MKHQYSYLVPEEWFTEYKKPTTTEERKQELENSVFKILRSVNTFPIMEVDFDKEISDLRNLVTLDSNEFYVDGHIKQSTIGNALCYKYYPNIFDVKKADSPFSMREGFHDDPVLKKVIKMSLTFDNSIDGFFAWFRMIKCGYCTNFRPSAAKIIYEQNGPKQGCRVYDFAAGYGGRLLGAWAANNVVEYVAVDPNTETWENANKFAAFLQSNYQNLEEYNIFKMGSEDFTIERFPQYKDHFDIAFTSPPYFNTEMYSTEETQSYVKFNNYAYWVKGFLRPTLYNAIDVLKPDGVLGVNIFVKLKNIKEVIQYICKERGFVLYKADKLDLHVRPGGGNKDGGKKDRSAGKAEPIFWFKHKDYL